MNNKILTILILLVLLPFAIPRSYAIGGGFVTSVATNPGSGGVTSCTTNFPNFIQYDDELFFFYTASSTAQIVNDNNKELTQIFSVTGTGFQLSLWVGQWTSVTGSMHMTGVLASSGSTVMRCIGTEVSGLINPVTLFTGSANSGTTSGSIANTSVIRNSPLVTEYCAVGVATNAAGTGTNFAISYISPLQTDTQTGTSATGIRALADSYRTLWNSSSSFFNATVTYTSTTTINWGEIQACFNTANPVIDNSSYTVSGIMFLVLFGFGGILFYIRKK